MDHCGENSSNKIMLDYHKVLNFKSTRDKSIPWCASGYGKFYYNEIKVLDNGYLEHLIGFHHGIDFCIQFKDLQSEKINIISGFEGEKQ